MEFVKEESTGNTSKLRCVLCSVSLPRKSTLLTHIKKSHRILQPYQCIACLKRYSSYNTLWRHRRSYCKGDRNVGIGMYTLPSFIRVCQLENWTPIFGDMLTCVHTDEVEVAVLYVGTVVGHVPTNLLSIFSKFLANGTITVRIAGALIDRGYGLEIPVDFIFNGHKFQLHKLIDNVESISAAVPDDL